MKKYLLIICTCTAIATMSCKNQNEAPANIFERKEADSNNLVIKYSYSVGGKEYVDSATIANRVLEDDTIMVHYKSDSPQVSTPQIPNK